MVLGGLATRDSRVDAQHMKGGTAEQEGEPHRSATPHPSHSIKVVIYNNIRGEEGG